MILQENDLQFDFQGCIDGFKFDESDPNNSYFHGLSHCMKSVDFIVETNDSYLFVEVKDYSIRNTPLNNSQKEELIKSLVGKFRDSFIYRWSEEKIDKPIKYLCLLELDNALISYLMNQLKCKLPVQGPSNNRWKQKPAFECFVVNIVRWNMNFPDWQVNRITTPGRT